jgi:hypothetical protein
MKQMENGKKRAACDGPFLLDQIKKGQLVNRACLKSCPTLFRFVCAGVARNHRVIVALQCQFAVSCDCVIGGKLENGHGIQNNSVIGIVVDGIAAQAVEQRTQVNQNARARVSGDVNSSIQVSIRVICDFDSTFAIAVDFGCACPFAMAGLAAVHAYSGIG